MYFFVICLIWDFSIHKSYTCKWVQFVNLPSFCKTFLLTIVCILSTDWIYKCITNWLVQFWVPSTILRTEKKYKCNSNWISEWWMTFCGNCICIDYILCNISIIDWKKICWWCSHILWRPWPRFKNKKSFRKDEYMFLFDGMPCQKWLGLTMATLWSVSITIPFFLLHFQSMTSASWYWDGHWNMLPYS